MVPIRKVLFPTDFSECSHAAWGHAVTVARQFGAEIVLLHVVAEPPRVAEAIEMGYTPEKFLKAATEEAHRLLADLIAAASDRKVPFRSRICQGVAFHEIIGVAREEGVDLIVMGTHGRTGLAHALMGSVAEKVVRKAPCPVLTVKHPGMKFEMP
jgi:nucleotide-binding universal stress UspA family protein